MQRNKTSDTTPTPTAVAAGGAATSTARAQSKAIKRQVREQFGRTAQAYVESAYHARGPDLARLVELAEPRTTDRALDISAGGGHTALALAPRVAHVIASDLTPTMLAAARVFLASRGVANVAYVVADAEHLPFLDASFDLVTVRMAPHHYADVRAATQEMARVLQPDGRLVLIDSVASPDPALDAFVNAIERRRDPSHVRSYTEREWRDLLGAAGLAISQAEQQRTTIDFVDWTARSSMPAEACAALEHDMLAAPPAIRASFAITEGEGHLLTWSCDLLVVRAMKPAG
ncbi:MAG TPA: methyltransferase domain-containing protein [Ktedonobacterales bacterium]|nr:methyltransferase domain-containing protein [Ktedonobacterales bacterium]